MLNPDYRDMLSALCAEEAEFLLVGAYALAAHGLPRATGDIDIWIRPSPENARRVWRALAAFGAPLQDLVERDLTTEGVVFQIGVAPRRVDILTSIEAVTFEEAWAHRVEVEIEGLKVSILGRNELLKNKRASGRPQDIADVSRLEEEDAS
ncbi:MAG: hypothetical protein GF330_07860 [Candidatus Eisenbacteria bacterium]|nr:hypothetical protein [Candidatus Eisenbacteria bacterium]